MSENMSAIYVSNTQLKAVFGADGPQPQFLLDTAKLKSLVVGLEPGQQIPLHSDEAAMYHFLTGEGLMTVGEETFAIQPGATVLVPAGAARGMNAKTRVIFLGAKGV
ncbi:MAG: cupin domain-containing protein [Anaerolineales bacterium]|jgi:quercetin dioxygenase-like cupin family protein|nr:cupin domain-containing protein [Anaerolineales bacterium]